MIRTDQFNWSRIEIQKSENELYQNVCFFLNSMEKYKILIRIKDIEADGKKFECMREHICKCKLHQIYK